MVNVSKLKLEKQSEEQEVEEGNEDKKTSTSNKAAAKGKSVAQEKTRRLMMMNKKDTGDENTGTEGTLSKTKDESDAMASGKKYLTVRKGKAVGSSKKDSEKEIKAKGDHNLSEGHLLIDGPSEKKTGKRSGPDDKVPLSSSSSKTNSRAVEKSKTTQTKVKSYCQSYKHQSR
ncbi:unnamed protein product [Rotaria sp. Silwood1]|nr:unnamed protein product [Rotaria sp. Silwood1]